MLPSASFSASAVPFNPLASRAPVASRFSSPSSIAARPTASEGLPRGHAAHASQLGVLGAAVAWRGAKRRGRQHKLALASGVQDMASTPGQDKYEDMVSEGRMITIEESNIRYAGAFVIFLIGVYKYVDMMSSGLFDYNAIAANSWGVYVLFESGRQSI